MTRSGEATPLQVFFNRQSFTGWGWSISPDGTRIALRSTDTEGNADIWVKRLPDGPMERLTVSEGQDSHPWWAPDDETVTYVARAGADQSVWSMRADGTGEPQLVLDETGSAARVEGQGIEVVRDPVRIRIEFAGIGAEGDFSAIAQRIAVGVRIERAWASASFGNVHFRAVEEPVTVGVLDQRIGSVDQDLLRVHEPVLILIGIVAWVEAEEDFEAVSKPVGIRVGHERIGGA